MKMANHTDRTDEVHSNKPLDYIHVVVDSRHLIDDAGVVAQNVEIAIGKLFCERKQALHAILACHIHLMDMAFRMRKMLMRLVMEQGSDDFEACITIRNAMQNNRRA